MRRSERTDAERSIRKTSGRYPTAAVCYCRFAPQLWRAFSKRQPPNSTKLSCRCRHELRLPGVARVSGTERARYRLCLPVVSTHCLRQRRYGITCRSHRPLLSDIRTRLAEHRRRYSDGCSLWAPGPGCGPARIKLYLLARTPRRRPWSRIWGVFWFAVSHLRDSALLQQWGHFDYGQGEFLRGSQHDPCLALQMLSNNTKLATLSLLLITGAVLW